MKKLIYTLSLLLFCQFVNAQVTGRVDTIITPDANNKALVEFKIRWPDGRTHIVGKMLNEKKEGVWRSYTNRSIIETIREYHEGKLNGVSFHFSENGTLDQEENYKNDVIGSHINAAVQLNFESRYKLSQHLFINFNVGITHFSNGSFRTPNLGINNPSVNGGFTYALHPPVTFIHSERLPYDRNIQLDVLYAAGVKGFFPAAPIRSKFRTYLKPL